VTLSPRPHDGLDVLPARTGLQDLVHERRSSSYEWRPWSDTLGDDAVGPQSAAEHALVAVSSARIMTRAPGRP
jgi:hypothetical protein